MLLHESVAGPVNVLSAVMVMAEVADPPAATEDGASAVAPMVKSGAAVTVRPIDLLWVNAPAVPVTVTLEVAIGVAVVVVMVRADVAGDAPASPQEAQKRNSRPWGVTHCTTM